MIVIPKGELTSKQTKLKLVLYLALLSCSLCTVKLHVVLLFEQIKKEGRKEGRKPIGPASFRGPGAARGPVRNPREACKSSVPICLACKTGTSSMICCNVVDNGEY